MAPEKKRLLSASQRIPPIARHLVSDRAKKTLDILEKFVLEEAIPAERVFMAQLGDSVESHFSSHPAIMEELKAKARKLGLWNLFLPAGHYKEGAGFTNLEYGLMAEVMAHGYLSSEACNCNAPDTGNMEVLAKYGTDAQKKQWLEPLLNGKIRSAFLMTEPDVASSDATNIRMTILREGDEYVLNGTKWWSSGGGDPRCAIYVVMGKTDPDSEDLYRQQSMVLVPANTKGVTVHRMLSVFGYDDAPHGHGQIEFKNVRVPASNMILGEGKGFEIAQGRLGPGRIHHAMRSVGAAERALDFFVARINDPKKIAFGFPLHRNPIMLQRLAECRVDIDAARLVVLNAAIAIDELGSGKARKEIAEAKILVPEVLLSVVDKAIQAFGAQGVCQDTPLARMYAIGRTMKIVDGPTEVHQLQLGRNENKRGKETATRLELQAEASHKALVDRGLSTKDILHLGKVAGGAKI